MIENYSNFLCYGKCHQKEHYRPYDKAETPSFVIYVAEIDVAEDVNNLGIKLDDSLA